MQFDELRQSYPNFRFRDLQITPLDTHSFRIAFDFAIESSGSSSALQFHPHLTVRSTDPTRPLTAEVESLRPLVFHLGMVELLSYWKATCAPEIIVECGSLTEEQTTWWNELLIKGLGEFFFVNKIDFTQPGLVAFRTNGGTALPIERRAPRSKAGGNLLLLSGGKDSVVSLTLLNQMGLECNALMLNPTQAALDLARSPAVNGLILVEREIDPQLLELNANGFLNGHTPFSAYLAALGLLCGEAFGFHRVMVSNERSSEEGNVEYLGHQINHQHSKTLNFERSFRSYSKRFLTTNVEYFSLLRPLYEIQLAKLFTHAPAELMSSFRSCNRGGKANIWCRRCPKCLFCYLILAPFLPAELMQAIFGENLFQVAELQTCLNQLLGHNDQAKPFECVGTRAEVLVALSLSIKKLTQAGEALPPLLRHAQTLLPPPAELAILTESTLRGWTDEHCLPEEFSRFLKTTIEQS